MAMRISSGAWISITVGVAVLAAAFAQYPGAVGEDKSSFQWPGGRKAALSLSFDDGRPSQLDNGLPILNRYGVKATFFINPGNVADRVDDWKMTMAQGHEIANHTSTHPCTGNFVWSRNNALEMMTLEDMAMEIEGASQAIQKLFGSVPQTFAYPCGQKFVGRGRETKSYVPLIAERFVAGRGWLGEASNDPGRCDLAQLLGVELDGLSSQEAIQWVEEAGEYGHWLVFCGHDIGGPNRQTTVDTTLDALCRYAVDPANGIWVATVERVAKFIKKQRNLD
jgi:peptidoglycan/xylan/chitin deacetylase (PgdA/CDA1 family)